MRHSFMIFLAFTLGPFVTPLYADVLDSEDFESFATVPFDISTDPSWTVAAGQEANVSVVSSSLSYTNGAVSVNGGNQALQVGPNLPSATTNNLADWVFAETSADTVWFSYLLQTSENASSSLPDEDDARNFFQMFISTDGSDNSQSLSMVIDNNRGGPPGGDHNFRARSGSSSQNVNGFTDSTGLVLNQPQETFLLVGSIEKVGDQYETISLYANPDSASAPAAPTATATWEPVELTSLQQLTFRISGLQDDDTYLLDQLTIGESYGDVVNVVPEPTAVSLLLLGSVLLGATRRRRPIQ